MNKSLFIRASLSGALTLGVLLGVCLGSRALRNPEHSAFGKESAAVFASAITRPKNALPDWAECVFNLDDLMEQGALEFRSSLPSRGLASAAAIRPQTIISQYVLDHHQGGAELENLTLALQAVDRTMIPPGSELSFNRATGPREVERGYKPGLMYSGGKVVMGVGGGVCVASTVLYNAALLAGLPIRQRWMHSGPTSYAEATRDAAVVFGSKDLVIKNNTANPIWIVTQVADKTATVKMLSTAPLPYKVVLKEEGSQYIPNTLATADVVDLLEPTVVSKGAPGCNRILYRQVWQGHKLIKNDLIAHDIRRPVVRVVGIPKMGDPMSTDPSGLGTVPALELPANGTEDVGAQRTDRALPAPDALPIPETK